MNILVLNWRDPCHPLAGGAELSLYEHIKYWQKKGAKVTWYASAFKDSKSEEFIGGIRIIRKGSHYSVVLKFFLDYIRGKFRDAEIVIDCFHFVPYFTVLFVKNKKIIAVINEVAGKIWFANIFFPLSFVGFVLEPYIIKMYKGIRFITGSESAKKDLKRVGVRNYNITVIHHGLNPSGSDQEIKKEKNPVIIFLGRISKDKGIEEALMAMKIITDKRKDVKLWIVGKFENERYKKKIDDLLEKLLIKDNVEIFGYVDEDVKFELLHRAWILIHPSVKEGWGLNVIEANFVATPAIGYNVAGLKDSIINGKTGLLINPDFRSLGQGVLSLIKDKNKLKKLSNAAKIWSKEFSWEKSGMESWNLILKEYGKEK